MVVGVARRERWRNGDNLRVIVDGEQLEGGKEGPMTATPSFITLPLLLTARVSSRTCGCSPR